LEEDSFREENFDQEEIESNSQVKIKDGLIIIEEAEAFLIPSKKNKIADTNYHIAALITPFETDVFI
jgi:predicted nuclease of restriction endonuclease-like (RecB) superfamily